MTFKMVASETAQKDTIRKENDYDTVTLLPSVKNFKDKVKEKMKESLTNNSMSALIIFDIDNFKYVNDSFGHDFGDLVLKDVGEEIRKKFNNNVLVCRYSGNTFITFIDNLENEDELQTVIKQTYSIFEKPYVDIYLTVSMGIAVIPEDGNEYESLLKNADIAMYEAKQDGKNKHAFFNKEMKNKLLKEYSLQKELRTALDKNEMYVVYQPKVSLRKGVVKGFEALVRWNNEKFGEISPGSFIPLAEKSRMIILIGSFVLEEACKKIKYLSDNGYKDFNIAVNLSEIQFQDGNFVNQLKEMIEKYEISPNNLELEITESMFMKSFKNNLAILEQIKKMGISIALDDFGTGYSSLSYLTKLPIDILKIDRSFIIDLCNNFKEKCMVESIISLSHKLHIKVVAEGVEEKEQVNYLKAIACDYVQGFFYSKPKPFNEVENMLDKPIC